MQYVYHGRGTISSKRKYEVGPPDDREKRIEFFFDYNKKRIILADLSKKSN